MKFGLIDPKARTFTIVDAEEPPLEQAGLEQGSVDHGVLIRGVGYIVYEYGLFVPPDEQCYFAVGRKLIAGASILYGYSALSGASVDFTGLPGDLSVRWLADRAAIEKEIAGGVLDRPIIRCGQHIEWSWPNPRPRY